MKNVFLCSLCRDGILGGALYLDSRSRAQKLTIRIDRIRHFAYTYFYRKTEVCADPSALPPKKGRDWDVFSDRL